MRSLALVTLLSSTVAAAEPWSGAATGPSVAATAEERVRPHGIAVGAELGDPTSVTIAWFDRTLVLGAAVGTGTLEGRGLQAHADAQLEVARLQPQLPLRIGLGTRLYHHGYASASIDEIPDTHLGLRASASLALERGRWELYLEAAPGLDVYRTSSCNLSSGARSVCPHAQEAPVFFQLAIGARWYVAP